MQKFENFCGVVFTLLHKKAHQLRKELYQKIVCVKFAVTMFQDSLCFRKRKEQLYDKLVTTDDTWLCQYALERKCRSELWETYEKLTPKELTLRSFVVKVMLTVFEGYEGYHHDWLSSKGHENGWGILLKTFDETKTLVGFKGKLPNGVLLLQENSTPLQVLVSTAFAADCRFESLYNVLTRLIWFLQNFSLPWIKERLQKKAFWLSNGRFQTSRGLF